MQAKTRQNWLKWHAYIACFFLPFIVLYAITGTLYLLDIKGSNSEELKLSVKTELWPDSRQDAEHLALQVLSEQSQQLINTLPDNYFSSGSRHSWFGFHYSIALNKGAPQEPEKSTTKKVSADTGGEKSKSITSENTASENIVTENIATENTATENTASEKIASEKIASEKITAENNLNKPPHQLEFNRHGWWKKLLYIHFGLAGEVFVVFGIALGACLLFSAISGAILLLSSQRYRRYAQIGILSSCLIIITAYFCV